MHKVNHRCCSQLSVYKQCTEPFYVSLMQACLCLLTTKEIRLWLLYLRLAEAVCLWPSNTDPLTVYLQLFEETSVYIVFMHI